MKKKLVIINGVMGVGKTTVSKCLYKQLNNSFWIDGDNCWSMNPFVVNDENKAMVLNNIAYIINSFLANTSSRYVVFNWVIETDDIMNSILCRINNLSNIEVYKITLTCEEEELIRRISKDITLGLRDHDNIRRSMERFNLYSKMDTLKIDTSGKSINHIVNEIKNIIF